MRTKTTIATLLILAFISIALVAGLFVQSEAIMKNENPFIRRFSSGLPVKAAEININSSSYIAGEFAGTIYLANYSAPLEIIAIDSTLKSKIKYRIHLNRDDFPFRSAEVKIIVPYFYIYDGMVPVIYRGTISDWKAKVIYNGTDYFTKALVANDSLIFIRGQKPPLGEHIIGTIAIKKTNSVQYMPDILQKQIDGIFDTDGTLQYSSKLRKFIYTYYYRNQYIVTDDKLTIQSRGNTIDTTTLAKLKIAKVALSGDTKLAAPPMVVNQNTTVYNNLFFVNSAIRGRFEEDEIWNHAMVIDVYDILKNQYISSFYIYKEGNSKLKQLLMGPSGFYVINGNHLQRYLLGKIIQ